MLNSLLSDFYERDLRRVIQEVKMFTNEDDLWKTRGTINNSSGNLVLHLVGSLNHLIGAVLGNTGYVRHRDEEFTRKGVEKNELVREVEALIPMIRSSLEALTPEQMDATYPVLFDSKQVSNSYILVQLLGHLNYHLGQINYLRRVLEQ
jgi:Protein of unknown function (DUF1572)